MGYQALLFCPDEKTARTVTQVLSELEFSVESCMEPFAAVKKLMSEHFDAVVVDCDNEQNATLLFKSARNSTSNQASLAVAVVEGQAGVAKAFRIGANLVLTKPINIEQSKGTLRVARGLLRKGEPAKPAAPAATAPTPSAPAKPAAPRPVATKPAAPVAPAASTPRPAAPPIPKPATIPAPARTAVASSAPAAPSEALPEITVKEPVAPPPVAAPAPVAPPRPILGSHTASIETTSGFTASPAAPAPAFSSGAASAPAPAREAQAPHVTETPVAHSSEADLFETPVEAVASESPGASAPAPSFTFGGANVPEKSSGPSKKILLGVVAAVLVVAALYAGWTYFQGRTGQRSNSPAISIPAPVATPQTATPASAAPKPAAPPTSPSDSALISQPAVQSPAESAATPTNNDAEDNEPAPESTHTSVGGSAKSSSSTSSPASKPAPTTKTESAPRVVKGGSSPALLAKPAVPDAPAPSVIGIATPGSNAPPPNLVSGSGSAPQPVLQALNISQGVSQGLLIKKVQPVYPRNALTMHVEGAVQLLATVSPAGNITAVKVVSGEPLLTKAAVDAVKQWKYKPYQLNGQPVEIQTQVTVDFKLPH